jgi:ribonuclease P protein component
MKKTNIVKSNLDFNNIMKIGKLYKNKYFALYIIKGKENHRFGIAVSKGLGKAVNRNKIKRQIKDIIDKINMKYNIFDCIIVARREIVNIEFNERKKFLLDLLIKANKEIEDEK